AECTEESGDLRCFTVRPRESDARAEIEAIRNVVIRDSELLLDRRIERRLRGEPVSVEANTVLNLEIAVRAIRVAERQGADVFALAALPRRELSREGCRSAGLEVGERIERKTSEAVRREVLRVLIATELRAELEAMLVILAHP